MVLASIRADESTLQEDEDEPQMIPEVPAAVPIDASRFAAQMKPFLEVVI